MAACEVDSDDESPLASATTRHEIKNAIAANEPVERRAVTPRAYRFLRPREESCRLLLDEGPPDRGRDAELRPAAARWGLRRLWLGAPDFGPAFSPDGGWIGRGLRRRSPGAMSRRTGDDTVAVVMVGRMPALRMRFMTSPR